MARRRAVVQRLGNSETRADIANSRLGTRTVPAGSFDALRITVRGYISETVTINYYSQSGSISNVIWYAPAVGQIVKKEIQHIDNSPIALGRLSERWELVECKPN